MSGRARPTKCPVCFNTDTFKISRIERDRATNNYAINVCSFCGSEFDEYVTEIRSGERDMATQDEMEYRAVFESPDGYGHLGRVFNSLEQAMADHPPRDEATLAVLVGLESRKMEPWRKVSLHKIIAAAITYQKGPNV